MNKLIIREKKLKKKLRMADKNAYQKLNSKIDYENPYMRVRKDLVILPNGKTKYYFSLDRREFSIIIPLTTSKKTYLVGQYRYSPEVYSWEFPMGYVSGKNPLEMAKIELKQETGLKALEWTKIGVFHVAPGHSKQKAHVFVARNLQEGQPQFEDHEFIEIKNDVNIDEVAKMINESKITDGPTIVAYHYLENYLKKQ